MADFLTTLASRITQLSGVSPPLSNALFGSASYDYIIGIGALSDFAVNFPDSSYIQSPNSIKLIAKTAGIDPDNRVATAYGKTDFYIDNLDIESVIGLDQGRSTNVTKFSFDIIEPFSMGLFMTACQYAASQVGHYNWLTAPFLMTISFRGTTETGVMSIIPNASKYIPFQFNDIKVKVTEAGAVYSCTAICWHDIAHDVKYSVLKDDAKIEGSTVQELLQSGPKSLQTVLNNKFKDTAKKTNSDPDQIYIIFPTDRSSGGSSSNASTSGATSAVTLADVQKQINVNVISGSAGTVGQNLSDVNDAGTSALNANLTAQGNPPSKADKDVWDPINRIYVRQNLQPIAGVGTKQYSKGQSIEDIITDVILTSEYARTQLTGDPDSKGMRQWFRIDTQAYNISSTANFATTGTKPQVIVYRVIPYAVHVSSAPGAANVQGPGLDELGKQVIKEYNYIYTGLNADIIKFDINFNAGFRQELPADTGTESDGKQLAKNEGDIVTKNTNIQPYLVQPRSDSQTNPPILPQQNWWGKWETKYDSGRGSNDDDEISRNAKFFHMAITRGYDMMNMEMEIIGDPYYIVQSGTGNYTAQESQYLNLTSDMDIDWQSSEVHIKVNFRSPIDLNQTTGLYDYNGYSKTAPVLLFQGLFRIRSVTSSFKGGQFTQKLSLIRLVNQESSVTPYQGSSFGMQARPPANNTPTTGQ